MMLLASGASNAAFLFRFFAQSDCPPFSSIIWRGVWSPPQQAPGVQAEPTSPADRFPPFSSCFICLMLLSQHQVYGSGRLVFEKYSMRTRKKLLLSCSSCHAGLPQRIDKHASSNTI